MNDLEICKRIAEIEKFDFITDLFKAYESNTSMSTNCVPITKSIIESTLSHHPCNPLTDDALCFQLMVKYEIDLSYTTDYNNGDYFFISDDGTGSINIYDKHPNKAICLAIIEAHK